VRADGSFEDAERDFDAWWSTLRPPAAAEAGS